MKRLISFIAAFLMIFSLSTGLFVNEANAAVNKVIFDDYEVVGTDTIGEDEEYEFKITLANTHPTDTANNVKLRINNKNFRRMYDGTTVDFGDIGPERTQTKTVKLKYVGEGKSLEYIIQYDSGTSVEGSIDIIEVDSDDSDATTDTTKYKPDVVIDNQEIPTATAGKEFNLKLNLKNEGKHMAKYVRVIAEVDENNGPFENNNLVSSKTISKISSGKSEEVNFSFNVKSGAEAGKYPIKIKYKYENAYKDAFPSDGKYIEQTIYVKVKEGYVYYEPIVKEIITNSDTIQAGENAQLTVKISNDGIYDLNELKVSLEGLKSEAFTVSDDFYSKKIYKLKALSDDNNVSFNLYADADMKEGNYPLTVKLEYKDNDNNTKTVEKIFYLKVASKESESISVENITFPKEQVVPGKPFDISFDVTNNGQAKAENLTVSINGGEEIVPKSQSTQIINKLNAGEKKNFVFTLQPISSAKAKNNLIKIEIKNNKNESVKTIEQYVGVEVGKGSNVIITNISSPNGMVSAKENFKVSIDVENQGIGTAKNVSASINVDKDIICKSQSVVYINKLDSKEKKTISFDLQAAELEDGKTCPIEITLNYDGNETPVKINTGVYVGKDDSNSKSKPKIIISKYKCEPAIVNAGEQFQIEINFLNTHSIKKVTNIKAFLTPDENVQKDEEKSGSVFSPVDSSNTFYIDEIAPKQSVTKTLKLFTMPYAKAKTYSVKINLEYEDDKGEEYKAEELIGIGVVQPSGFMTTDIKLPEEAFVGQPIPVSLEINNTGKVILDNFMVSVDGEFKASNTKTYIGNIEPGNTEYYDVELTPDKEGEVKGNLIFSYDEPNGKRKEVKKEIKVTASQMPEPDPNMEQMNMEMEAQKGGATKKIIIILAGVIAALVVGVIIVKKRKKKKEMSIDE